jgi:glycerol-3-phosphate dehydrogenase (NAD(P)+)
MLLVKPFKIAILGGGSWGTTTASVISRNCTSMLWARDTAIVDEINKEHRNPRYLGDAALNPKLRATADIGEAVSGTDAVLIAVPSTHFREVLTSALPDMPEAVPVISLSKGLEKEHADADDGDHC